MPSLPRPIPLLLAIMTCAAACHGTLTPVADDDDDTPGADAAPAGALTWAADVGPALAAAGCVGCHGTAGDYGLDTYAATMSAGSDAVPNVIPGDDGSELIAWVEDGHGGPPANLATMLTSWVVEADAAP